MTKALSMQVIRELQRMYGHFRKPLEDDDLLLWSRHLGGYHDADIIKAFGIATARAEAFCPVIGNVLNILSDMHAQTQTDAGAFWQPWSKVLEIISREGGVAAQHHINRLDEVTKRVMINRIEQWVVDCTKRYDEDSWPPLMVELQNRVIERTDGQMNWYFFAVLDDLPFIVAHMQTHGLLNMKGQA